MSSQRLDLHVLPQELQNLRTNRSLAEDLNVEALSYAACPEPVRRSGATRPWLLSAHGVGFRRAVDGLNQHQQTPRCALLDKRTHGPCPGPPRRMRIWLGSAVLVLAWC